MAAKTASPASAPAAQNGAKRKPDRQKTCNARDYGFNLVLLAKAAKYTDTESLAGDVLLLCSGLLAEVDSLLPLPKFDCEVVMGDLGGAIERTC